MKKTAVSLRTRLVLIVFATTLLVWAAAGWKSYQTALSEVGDLLDGQMAQSAKLLMAQVRHEEKERYQAGLITRALAEITLHPYEQPLEFQIWGPRGQLLLRSVGAPAAAMADRPGFADIGQGGQRWRQFTIGTDGSQYQIQVAQRLSDRHEAALRVAGQALMPMLLALPLLAALTYWAARRGLRPLDRLAGDVAARDPKHLHALVEAETPREARPLVVAVNTLLARLDTALNNERRFTADAAHELRTPLAAVKVHAQVALASPDGDDRHHALSQVLVGSDRAGRLVEQLLRLARLDPLSGLGEPRTLMLGTLAAGAAEAMRPGAEAAGQALSVSLPDQPATIRGDPDMLALALRNLLENAVRYTPAGGRVEIGVEMAPGTRRLLVRDDGPGVAAEELPRLAERFYRGRNIRTEGSGLGLAIVQRVAELHGARLSLANLPEGGFQAALDFPLPGPA